MDRAKRLSKEEAQRVLAAAALEASKDMAAGRMRWPTIYMAVDLALNTGLRVSEIASIETADIDLKEGYIVVVRLKKRKRTGRMVTDASGNEKPEWVPVRNPESLPIAKDLRDHLKVYIDWRKKRGLTGNKILVGRKGPLTKQGVQGAWNAAVIAAGMTKIDNKGRTVARYSIHCARHTFLTEILKKTGNLSMAQQEGGHSSPTTTANMYYHPTDEERREAKTGLYAEK